VDTTENRLVVVLQEFHNLIEREKKLTNDVNGDGTVNILDLVTVASGFGTDAPDINGDGVVNILDLVAVANQFGQ